LFASAAINGVNGFLYGNPSQLVIQLIAVVVVVAYAFVGSLILLKVINVFTPIRVSAEEEEKGLDESQHGEVAYGGHP
jgi:Amt family ammonium transporter